MLLKKLTTNVITRKWKEIFNHNVDCLNDLETIFWWRFAK